MVSPTSSAAPNLAPSVLIIAGVSFLAHVLVGNNYGYFRDELYVMAMSQHPAFGYVDVPPLVPWITLIPRFLTGNALWAIHVISALVCAGTILLTGLMARLLGGAGWVQGLAALASATALVFMANGSIYAYDVFDVFWWTLAATILIVLLRDNQPRWWLAFGLVAGLGLLTKETILFWGFALVARLAADSTTPPAVHPLDAVWWTDRLCPLPAIPALECRQWLGVAAVLDELFRQSWRRWVAHRFPGEPDPRHESPLGTLVGSGAVVLLLQTRRALSRLWLGVPHPLRALHRDTGEDLLSGAGLPAALCWWGDGGWASGACAGPDGGPEGSRPMPSR